MSHKDKNSCQLRYRVPGNSEARQSLLQREATLQPTNGKNPLQIVLQSKVQHRCVRTGKLMPSTDHDHFDTP
jgi:hypothetical protein